MAEVRFNLNLKGRSFFPLVQNPVGFISILLNHRVQKQYRTSDEQTILFQDYTIVPQQRFPIIQIPVFSSFYCSLHLSYALHHLGFDGQLLDFLHQCIGKMSIGLSLRGLTGFDLLARVEVVEVEVVEIDEQIEKWRKKEASRIMVKKLEKRQRRFMDVNEVKVGENCSVCLEEFEEERQLGSVIMMPCSHRFHRSCISRWLEEQNSCPMCRRGIQALDLVSQLGFSMT